MLKPASCNSCPLYKYSHGFSTPEGKGTLGVTIIGDNLDNQAIIDAIPFPPYSKGGSALEWAFSSLHTVRSQFNLTNLIQCSPYDSIKSSPFYSEGIRFCYETHTKARMHRYKHSIFVTLGPTATYNLTQWSGSDDDKTSLEYIRGYITPIQWAGSIIPDAYVIPSYHPLTIRGGNPVLIEYLKHDLRLALKFAQGDLDVGTPSLEGKEYNTKPSIGDMESYYAFLRDNENLPINYDIETPTIGKIDEEMRAKTDRHNARILQMQFSHKKDFGIAFPYTREHAEWAKKIMFLFNKKVGHNSYGFDDPILEDVNGFVINGPRVDTMWLVKHTIPGLDLNLQSCASISGFRFPWKHFFGEEMPLYGCCDVDAGMYVYERFKDFVSRYKPRPEVSINGLPSIHHPKPRMTLAHGYNLHVKGYYQMALKPGRELGIPVAFEEYDKLESKLKKEILTINDELQELIPPELKNSKQKNGYKKVPKEILEAKEVYKHKREEGETFKAFVFRTITIHKEVKKKGKEPEKQELKFVKRVFEGEERWCLIVPFKPSSHQVKKYIKWKQSFLPTIAEKKAYNLPINRKSKSKDKTTTGKDALAEVVERTGDEVLSKVLEIRSIAKMLKNDIHHWRPSERTTFYGEERKNVQDVFVEEKNTELDPQLKDLLEDYNDDDIPF